MRRSSSVVALILAVVILAGCSFTGAVQKYPPLPRPDVSAAQFTNDQDTCEKTAQETRSSPTGAILGAGWIGYFSAQGEYGMLYVDCMRKKGYAFKEPLP